MARTRGKRLRFSDTDESKGSNSCLRNFVVNWVITDPLWTSPEALEHQRQIKNYQIQNHEGLRYIYLFGGRLRTVKQKPLNVATGVAILVPGVLFYVFEARWTWHHISPAVVIVFAYLWFLVVMFYLRASLSDAGVLPRNVHVPFNVNQQEKARPPDEYFNTVSLPYCGGSDHTGGVTVKYCSTCHIWRPPRASHCSICNSCIINHDHHCVFLNNCIGYRNHKYFLWFLLTSVCDCVLLVVISLVQVLHYKINPTPEILTFKKSITKHPVGFLLVIYGLLALIYPLLVLAVHILLTSLNITTREYLNNVKTEDGRKRFVFSPFQSFSFGKNLYINWLGKPKGISLVQPTELYDLGDLRFKRMNPLQSFNVI